MSEQGRVPRPRSTNGPRVWVGLTGEIPWSLGRKPEKVTQKWHL